MDERLNEILEDVFQNGYEEACNRNQINSNNLDLNDTIKQAKDKIYELIEFSEIELEDIKVWANGIQGVLGSEYADRVTEEESKISYLILNPEKVVPKVRLKQCKALAGKYAEQIQLMADGIRYDEAHEIVFGKGGK